MSDAPHPVHPAVPGDGHGPSKNFSEVREFDSIGDAEDAFLDAKNRLLRPDQWHALAGILSAEFTLCSGAKGQPVTRAARKGDLLRIHVPGPAGMAADWVRVEEIAYDDYPDENRETLALRVRPTADPTVENEATAHFFSEAATSCWILERRGKALEARYHGRDEVPNTAGEGMMKKARDLVTAVAGLIGFSDLQWKALLVGFLDGK